MTRWVRAAVLSGCFSAAAGAASAAPIGTFSVFGDEVFGKLLDLSNDSGDLVFSNLKVAFCDGSVKPAAGGSGPGCEGDTLEVAGFGSGEALPGGGLQFAEFLADLFPTLDGFDPEFAFLLMTVRDTSGRAVPFSVDPLDVSCENCTNFITADREPGTIPEPASAALLGLGLAARGVARRLGRRRR